MKTYDLTGKVAVVLGASADRGIGWATAVALAEAGAKVVVGARTLSRLQVLADKIGGIAVACDAGNDTDIANIAKVALDTYGQLDIAINCAASQEPGLFQNFKMEDLRKVAEVNFFGMASFIKHASLAMEANGPRKPGEEGSIILMSSICSTHPTLPLFSYGSTKAAIDCMVRYAALELGPKHIKVNSIVCGPVITELTHALFDIPGVTEVYNREIPFGRVGKTEDIVDGILWLADSAYETGLNLHLSGGMQLGRFPYPQEMPAGVMESYENTKPASERNTSK